MGEKGSASISKLKSIHKQASISKLSDSNRNHALRSITKDSQRAKDEMENA